MGQIDTRSHPDQVEERHAHGYAAESGESGSEAAAVKKSVIMRRLIRTQSEQILLLEFLKVSEDGNRIDLEF